MILGPHAAPLGRPGPAGAVPLAAALLALAFLPGCPKRGASAGGLSAEEVAAVLSIAADAPEEALLSMASDRADPATSATFRGRAVDVAPHVHGYPYRSFLPFPELGELLYMREDADGRYLHSLPLDQLPALGSGRRLSDIDWTKRSFRAAEPLPRERAILFVGDEDNREDYDLYKLFLDDGRIEKVTSVPYVYGFGVDVVRDRAAYVSRHPIAGTTSYRSCLELLPLPAGASTTVVCDDAPSFGAARFTWSSISFSPDGEWAYLSANLGADRKRKQLVRVRLDPRHPAMEPLLAETERSIARVLDTWLDGERFAYYENAAGFANLGVGSLGGPPALVTDLDVELKDVAVLQAGGTPYLLAAVGRPWETELRLLDSAGKVLAKKALPDDLTLLRAHRNAAWFYATSRGTKMRLLKVMASDFGGFIVTTALEPPPDLLRRIDRCVVERVQIPTFDTDPATGERRLLHAYLSTPREPTAGAALAGIVAFYGGGNQWDTQAQVLCDAGITTLSPAVRGSFGFGSAFYALNDGDLGGDEIVDLQEMARWLVATKGFAPRDVGVFGSSHGGYATLRALTFPPETNGRGLSFPWGWGVSFYGFSDIATFWATSNIPDWVILEAGDPSKEPEKIRARSPLHHVARLDAPVLLLHGENDQRVPVQESRQFADACAKAGKDCTYVEFPGQGHGLRGLDNEVAVWRAVFAYLERARPAEAAP